MSKTKTKVLYPRCKFNISFYNLFKSKLIICGQYRVNNLLSLVPTQSLYQNLKDILDEVLRSQEEYEET